MVGPRFKRNLNFLKNLCREKSNSVKLKMIKNASDEEIYSIMDAATNVLNFNVPLKKSQKKKLAQFAQLLRTLSKKRSAKSGKKIIQKGGGPMVAALLIPILAEVGSRIISHLVKK